MKTRGAEASMLELLRTNQPATSVELAEMGCVTHEVAKSRLRHLADKCLVECARLGTGHAVWRCISDNPVPWASHRLGGTAGKGLVGRRGGASDQLVLRHNFESGRALQDAWRRVVR